MTATLHAFPIHRNAQLLRELAYRINLLVQEEIPAVPLEERFFSDPYVITELYVKQLISLADHQQALFSGSDDPVMRSYLLEYVPQHIQTLVRSDLLKKLGIVSFQPSWLLEEILKEAATFHKRDRLLDRYRTFTGHL